MEVKMASRFDACDLLAFLINEPPGNWYLAEQATTEALGEAVRQLDEILERGARLRGYLDGRYAAGPDGCGHERAVRMSNDLVAKVRAALGFVRQRADISF